MPNYVFDTKAILSIGLVAGMAAVGMAGGAALADDEPPAKVRQDIMKTVGFSAKTAGKMVKGEEPYDPVKAELAMRAINAAATAVPNLFPEDSKTGYETEADPKIWEDMEGFLHEAHELKEHSARAAAAAENGLEAFKAEFVETAEYCKSCHESYRIEKED